MPLPLSANAVVFAASSAATQTVDEVTSAMSAASGIGVFGLKSDDGGEATDEAERLLLRPLDVIGGDNEAASSSSSVQTKSASVTTPVRKSKSPSGVAETIVTLHDPCGSHRDVKSPSLDIGAVGADRAAPLFGSVGPRKRSLH